MTSSSSATTTDVPGSPLVSICVPTYNGQEFLAETLASALRQTYPTIEIIVSDDNSSDQTVEIAETFAKQCRFPIRVLSHARLGLVGNWSHCISQARGKYIKFLFQDDLLEADCVAQLVAVAEQDPEIGLVFSRRTVELRGDASVNPALAAAYRDSLDLHKGWMRLMTIQSGQALLKDPRLFQNPINKIGEPTTVLLSKAAVERAGGFDPDLRQLVDVEFWLRLMTTCKVGFVDRALSCFRLHAKQATQANLRAGLIAEDWKRFYGKLASDPRFSCLPAAHRAFASKAWAKLGGMAPATAMGSPEKFRQAMEDTERFLRERQFAQAIAQAELALKFAPSAEHATRMQGILTMLRGAALAAERKAETSAPTEASFFGRTEFKNIERMIADYTANPADDGLRGQLTMLQRGMADFIIGADPVKLEDQFRGDFGEVYRALLKSGLTSEPPTAEIQARVSDFDAKLGAEADCLDLRLLLARMLCAPAHRGSVVIPPARVPVWLREDYLKYVLQPPQVFVLAGEAEQYHTHLLGWMKEILHEIRFAQDAPATLAVATFFALKVNFIPAYFSDRNLRELAEKRAAIIEFSLRKKGAVLDARPHKRPKNRQRIKVGYVCAHFGAQTETHVTLPMLQLDRERFEVCLFPVGRNEGPVENYCRTHADSFTPLPAEVHRQVQLLREAALDIAIFGTNITAVTNRVALIALHRIAPLQLASYCSPISTGMRHMDGFLSGTLTDCAGLQEHFTEKLHFCDGPPGCLDYTVEAVALSGTYDRARLGLAADDVVFINAAACFKILPEMLETWARILAAVPRSRLVLLPFNPNWTNAFPVRQFERTLTEIFARHGIARDRFILIGSLPTRADVKALEQVADVYLDTSPFSGSISVIDPLEMGLPTVVRQGSTHRSRMAAALLRELDIPELVTETETDYIALAVRLGREPVFRGQVRDRILASMARRPKFINPQSYASALGHLLESLVLDNNRMISPPAVAIPA